MSANPRNLTPLMIEEERMAIDSAIQSAKYRDQFEIVNWDGITVNDFQSTLLRFQPVILHVSTQFTKRGEPVFLGEGHEAKIEPLSNFVYPIKFLKGKLKGVILNGEYTESLAQEISSYVDFVIGVSGTISDEEAITFSKGFYGAIANGGSVGNSFALARSISSDNFQLKSLKHIDMDKSFIIEDSTPTSETPTSETPTSETPTSETPTSETPTSETPISNERYHMKYDSIDIYPDDPTNQDSLSRLPVAEVLARRIKKMRVQNPNSSFLINLDGPWGSGKTSLLRLLKTELEGKGNKPTWLVVDFNAWQNQRISSPWWSLIDSIYQQTLNGLKKISYFNYIRIVVSESLWRAKIKRSRIFFIVPPVLFLFGLVILFSGIDLSNIGRLTEAGKAFADLLQNISGIIAVIGSIITGILLLKNSLLPTATTDPSELFKSFNDPMKELSIHFAQYANKYTSKFKVPIAVFIDDLDRCTEKYTVEFLEGIQTIFREGPVVYVIAADRRWIQLAYEKIYEYFMDIGEPARPLGHLFLGKIFQMSIPIPTMNPDLKEKFLNNLLKHQNLENDVGQKEIIKQVEKEIENLKNTDTDSILEYAMTREGDPIYVQTARNISVRKLEEPKQESETELMLQKFHHLLESNPRAIKRLLNTFVIYRAILIIQGIKFDFEILALWVILMMRWPILSDYISKHPDLLNHLSDESLTGFPDMPEKLKLLLSNKDFIRIVNGDGINTNLDETAIRQITQLY